MLTIHPLPFLQIPIPSEPSGHLNRVLHNIRSPTCQAQNMSFLHQGINHNGISSLISTNMLNALLCHLSRSFLVSNTTVASGYASIILAANCELGASVTAAACTSRTSEFSC